MYNALTIAHYIIDYYHQRRKWISNLKLQPLLYLIQANFLISLTPSRPCFKDKILAWDFGPVVPDVYHNYLLFGASYIPIEYDRNRVDSYEAIDYAHLPLLDQIIEKTLEYSTHDLCKIIYHQAPYVNAKQTYTREIMPQDLANYFLNRKG